MSTLIWFRRDLRLRDHPALRAALASDDLVIPVFCFDPRLLAGRHRSGPRTQFLLESLSELEASLRARGSRLVVRAGPPERELAALATDCKASEVHISDDPGPFGRRRDARVAAALGHAGARLVPHPGACVIDDVGAVTTSAREPYAVFTPYYRRWLDEPRRAVLPAPRSLPEIPGRLRAGRLPSLSALGLEQALASPARGGERNARVAMRKFLTGGAADYVRDHDAPAVAGTSRLSPYLRFGCLSPRELEQRLPAGDGPERLPAPALLARLLRAGAARVAPEYALRASAALPRNAPLEPLARIVRRVVPGADGISARRRGDARAAPGGADAQPRADGRRVVPHQGPRNRLALGRALVHAAAARRRRGEQQRKLAMDRVGRSRPAAAPIVDHAHARREALARYAAAF